MKTVSSLWVCDYCGAKESSGEDRPDCWPVIEMRFTNGKYSGFLFDADICKNCWMQIRGNDSPSWEAKKAKWHGLFRRWLFWMKTGEYTTPSAVASEIEKEEA